MAYMTGLQQSTDTPLVTTQVIDTHAPAVTTPSLKVLTLNIAHGRGAALNQIFLNRKAFDANLEAISDTIRQTSADIVALQEVDNSSLWSGRFDHAEHIALQAGYRWRAHAGHASSWLFNFGTAVLSRLPIVATHAGKFPPSPPTLRKGFVIGQVAWPHADNPAHTTPVDIVSVHLDFLSKQTRATQIDQLVETLSRRQNPMIVLGDFNSEWQTEASPVQELTRRLELSTFQPEAPHLATHNNTRIDWIFLSPELQFKSYSVLPEIISDHQAVVAEVEFTDSYLAALPLLTADACPGTQGCATAASASY
jgi:endonuclease/exonuclease/phosphatase family metal-dependent hydrolase